MEIDESSSLLANISLLVENATTVSPKAPRLDYHAIAPTGREWMEVIPTSYLVFLIICSVFVGLTLLLSVAHLYAVQRYVSGDEVRANLRYLCLLCPMLASASLIGMYMPRNLDFLKLICHVYAMGCLHVIVALLRHLFGGRAEMSLYLLERNERIALNKPPFCCCCHRCFPDVAPTEKSLRRLEYLITQCPKVRITLEVINVIAFNERRGYAIVSAVTDAIETISMFIAIYGCEIIMHLGQEKMNPCRMKMVFGLVNFTHVAVLVQQFAFEMIGKFNGFVDGPELSSSLKAYYWNACMLVFEMLVVSMIATVQLHPRRCAIFDKYQSNKALPTSNSVIPIDGEKLTKSSKEHTV